MSAVSKSKRLVGARLKSLSGALAENRVILWDTWVNYAYDASGKFQPQEVLKEEVTRVVVAETRQQLDLMEH